MLRITQVDEPTLTRLKVEGRLDARSVGELLRSCRPALRGRAVVLDFSSVLFVDRSAALAVRQLLAQDVRLEACPPFIAQLLEEDPNALAGS